MNMRFTKFLDKARKYSQSSHVQCRHNLKKMKGKMIKVKTYIAWEFFS